MVASTTVSQMAFELDDSAVAFEPREEYSDKFNLRVSPQLHAAAATRAAADGKSLNQWVADVLDQSVHMY